MRTRDNEWQCMTIKGNLTQKSPSLCMKMHDNEWQWMAKNNVDNDDEWQWMTIIYDECRWM